MSIPACHAGDRGSIPRQGARLKKAAISRLIGKIERAIACKDTEAVSLEVVELKRQFCVLEDVHNAIHNAIENCINLEFIDLYY